jgi:hormone-sensitive lipase
MASYEEWYKGSKEDPVKQLFSSLLNGGKYIQHPTQRGVKIADLTEDCSIDFTKAFWSITEQTAITTVAKFVSLNVDVSECIEVPAKDISVLSSLTGESVQIRPPFSDLGYKPVPLTLISFKHRDGQKSSRYGHRTTLPPSYALVIHFHGGGFVAQSSKSHEFYLRFWSRDLDCPILSVDYSLAPDGCYPRNLDECVFAYAWALNNFSILGTTGEKIILAGDSTGGYFAITTAMKIKQLGLRMPDEVFAFYPPTMLSSLPTPSRFLSFMDTLLPIGILISCLQAFAGMNPSDELRNKRKISVRRILKAKGYIIPSIVNPYVTPKAQSRFEKLADGFQRKKKSSSIDEASKDSTKSPPPRPPPPKSSISVKPKPERPPPPSRQSTTGSISGLCIKNL